jgi:molybdopterin/thiamine biosynthesis adenylyltransferase
MPEVSIMDGYREEGISVTDSFLVDECGALRLPDSEARSFKGRHFATGWQLMIETALTRRRLDIYVDQEFPFSQPYFVLVDRPLFPTWPHVEEDGVLCLSGRNVAVDPRLPDKAVGDLLRDAVHLVLECESAANQNDFRSEFNSYWGRSLTTEAETVVSLLEPRGPSRLVPIWRGKVQSVVGEIVITGGENPVLRWLRNLYGNERQFNRTDLACFLWMDRALLPGEYPKTAVDLYRLAEATPGGQDLLERFATEAASPFYFVLGAECGNGPCLAAVRTYKPVSLDIRGKALDRSNDGFRHGKMPGHLQAQRLFSPGAGATRLAVERGDAAWIHGRGQDPRQKELSSKMAIIFGCGSVGAPVAHQLAMAGVRHVVLVDPEKLSWANVGRHPLGADFVRKSKAVSLAELWRKSYPHAEFKGLELSLHSFVREQPELLKKADIIICATVDWKSEQELNFRQVAREIAVPILYSWTEPNACAGHAVAIFPGGACLQCGFSTKGDCKLEVTEWVEGQKQRQEPACGAIFQPYGPVELLGTISVTASLALDVLLGKTKCSAHRIWAGPESLLLEAGGAWSESWVDGRTERRRGGFQEDRGWEKDVSCHACGHHATDVPSSLPSENPDNVSSSPLLS